jgi:hypothetical protein
MTNNITEEYIQYSNKIGNRLSLYKKVIKKYEINSILYPGSHIDIGPSLIIPRVTYVDNFKGAVKFFKKIDEIKTYIDLNKEYLEPSEIVFINQDYNNKIEIDKVDMIISQYAGFVGQATKQNLKKGGILLCNDSHGDATLSYNDSDFKLIAVINSNNKIIEKNFEQYFKLSKDKLIDFEKVKKTMKGPKYLVSSENYIFRKL